jgi:hypothetical protein
MSVATSRSPAGAQAASALKVFSERLDATSSYIGIDLRTADLRAAFLSAC